jgi:hypothetical protein
MYTHSHNGRTVSCVALPTFWRMCDISLKRFTNCFFFHLQVIIVLMLPKIRAHVFFNSVLDCLVLVSFPKFTPRWKNNIKDDIRNICYEIVNWILMFQDGLQVWSVRRWILGCLKGRELLRKCFSLCKWKDFDIYTNLVTSPPQEIVTVLRNK